MRALDGTVIKPEPVDDYQTVPYNPDDEYEPALKLEPLVNSVEKAFDGKPIKSEPTERLFNRNPAARPRRVADPTRVQRHQQIRRNEVPMEDVVDLTSIKEEEAFSGTLAVVNAHSYAIANTGAPSSATPLPGLITPHAKAAKFRAQLSKVQREKANLAIDGTSKLHYDIDSPTAIAAQEKLKKELEIDGTKKLRCWSHKGTTSKTRSQIKQETDDERWSQFENGGVAPRRVGGAVCKRFSMSTRSSKRPQTPTPLSNVVGRTGSSGKIEKSKKKTTPSIKERKEAETYGSKAIANGSASVVHADTARDNDVMTPWCVCREPVHGPMILCDNEYCNVRWFHFGCVGIKSHDGGEWYCFECRMARAMQ